MTKRSQPTGRISHPTPSILFLSGDSELSSLSFVYDQGKTLVAINTGVAPQCEEKVLLLEDLGILLWDSMPATGARQISYFSLAEGTRSSCATEDGKIPQAGLSFLRELIAFPTRSNQPCLPRCDR